VPVQRDRAIDGSPNDPGCITVVMGPGFRSDPNMHRAYKRPTQSADRSTATGVASARTFCGNLESSKSTSTKERSSTELRFASSVDRLSTEWRAVKGQDERSLTATPLTALHSLADEVNKMEKPSRRLDFYDLLIEALKISDLWAKEMAEICAIA
jgi:hypothetical protein